MRFTARQITYAILLVAIILFIFGSYRPHSNLQLAMPAAFGQPHAPWTPANHRTADDLALAYWSSAVTLTTNNYNRGDTLPQVPPPQYSVDGNKFGAEANSPRVRDFYWSKLQEAWTNPASWERHYEWDVHWFSGAVMGIGRWLDDTGHNFIRTGPLER